MIGSQEIIVTAQKREANVQGMLISIMAFGSETLEKRGVSSLVGAADVERIVARVRS